MDILDDKRYGTPSLSYWIDSAEPPISRALREDTNVDVAIIGGGMAGILTAYQLSQKGLNPVIFEARKILRETTGNTTAKITSQHDHIYQHIKHDISEEFAKQYADANETAIREIKKLAAENNIDCDFMDESAFLFTISDKYVDMMEGEAVAAASLGIKADFIKTMPVPLDIKGAVRFQHQAQFHPLKFLNGIVSILKEKQVKLYENTRIVNVENNKTSYELTTEKGNKITADFVVMASHFPFNVMKSTYFARMHQSRSYVIAIKAKEKFPGGMYINVENPTRSIRNQPYSEGELIIISGEAHKTGVDEHSEMHYQALLDFANENFNVIDVLYRWSAQDCITHDGLPYVGHFTSDNTNAFVATGFKKWGMTNSMAASMIISDLIVKGNSPWQDVYNPAIKTLGAQAKEFLKDSMDVAANLVKGKIQRGESDAEVKNGEAKVINKDGNKVGVYRDYNGKIHAVDTTCTHMGCELSWNSAEKTWDCPCHGSRFTFDGEILEGPAIAPLKLIE